MNAAITLMNKLTYPKKMLLISIVFLIPIILLIAILFNQLGAEIRNAGAEERGLEYIKTVRQLYQHMPQHRGMTNAYLNGASQFRSKILDKRKAIIADMAAIDAVNDRFGDEFKTNALWKEIKQTWQQLKPQAFNGPAKKIFQQHTKLISRIYNLFERVSNESGLVLDPALNTSYLMDAIVYRLPMVTEYLGQSRGMGAGVAAKGEITLEQRIALGTLVANIESNAEAVDKGMVIILRETPQLKSELSALLSTSRSATESFVNKVNNELLTAEFISSDPKAIFASGTAAIKANYQVYDKLVPVLDQLFQARMDKLSKERTEITVIILVALSISIYLFIYWFLSINENGCL